MFKIATGYLSFVSFAVALIGASLHATGVSSARLQPETPRLADTQAVAAQGRAASPEASPGTVVTQYCVGCHNQRLKTAGLILDTIDVANVGANPQIWEKVLRKLRTREMPPRGSRRPDDATYDAVVATVGAALDRAAAVAPNPGRTPARRLTRTEYTNAIRDLLALEINGPSLLLEDDVSEGFDNMAGTLTVSPALLERYLAAARRSGRLAVGDPTIGSAFTTATYRPPKGLKQEERMSEDLPFGSRGGLAIRHYFPLDGDYIVKVSLQRNLYDFIRGLREPNDLEVRLDGQRLKVFTVGGKRPPTLIPETFAGKYAGDSPEWDEYMVTADKGLEVRFSARAGLHVVGVSFVDRPWEGEGVAQPTQSLFGLIRDETSNSRAGVPQAFVDTVVVSGPFDAGGPGETASRRRLFVCRPSEPANEESCATTILSTVARRAYRRPVAKADIQMLLGLYKAGREKRGFEAGIQEALVRLLVDPSFLFRVERDPTPVTSGGAAYRLTDVDLASRLSFFLWSSIPDDELLDVAVRGRLKEPRVLEQQVRRMMADARSKALVENFAAQWLEIPRLDFLTPNAELYPEFDDNLRQSFAEETKRFVADQLQNDRPVIDLVTANYTFVNERLARHYGIPNIHGSQFRRVTFDDTSQRGGVLGHGSILTLTSYGNRTSPVIRGKWLLDNIFGQPPPPPPPNIPALPETGEQTRLSMREQMERHRANPACAVCHVRMDPLGLALENFDATGAWRSTTEGGTPIDASGSLPDGTRFDGLAGLRRLGVSHRDEFVTTVTEKLLTYALGRGLEHYDMPAVRTILRGAAPSDYRWSSLILGVVRSIPFQMRRPDR